MCKIKRRNFVFSSLS
uniref:Uncharacterized protein n=1 Tax=Arundo donax TaxID=35708 RepID=A0A0A8Y2Z2_ARUDO